MDAMTTIDLERNHLESGPTQENELDRKSQCG